MNDHYRREAAKGQLENALNLLKQTPPVDPVARRRQHQEVAQKLYEAADLLVGELEVA